MYRLVCFGVPAYSPVRDSSPQSQSTLTKTRGRAFAPCLHGGGLPMTIPDPLTGNLVTIDTSNRPRP